MGGNLKPGDVVRAVRHKKFPHVVAQLNGRTTGDAWAEGSAMKSVHHRLTRSQDPSDYKELVVLDTVTGPKAIDKREQVIQRLGDDPKVANFVEEETRDDLPLSIEERFVYQDLNFVDADFAAEARDAVLQAPAAPKPSLMADHLERTVENAHPEIGEDWRMQRTSLFRELGTVDELARGDRWTKPSIAGNLGKVLDHAADLKRKPQNFPVRETGWPPRAPLAPAEPAERRDGDARPGEAGPPSR